MIIESDSMRVNNKGFTLVEILATLTILSIVSVLAVGGYIRYADYAKKKAYVTMAKSASIAGEQFVMDNPGAAVEVEEQAKDGGVIYRIRNVDTAPGITFSELIEDAYLNSAVDPDDKGNKCTGTVRIGLVSAKEKNALDSYIYVVDVCCSLHQARYTYTMSKKDGKTSSVEEVTKPSYICGKGTPPAPTAAPVDPSPDDDTPTPTTTDVNLACPTVTAKSNGNNYTQGTTVSKPIEFTFHFDSNTKEYDWYTKKNSGDFKYWSTNNISVTKKKITSSGTHQIKMIIRDGKGNEKTCNYTGEYKIEDGASSPSPSPSPSSSPGTNIPSDDTPSSRKCDYCGALVVGTENDTEVSNYSRSMIFQRKVNGVWKNSTMDDDFEWTKEPVEIRLFILGYGSQQFENPSQTIWTYSGNDTYFNDTVYFNIFDNAINKNVKLSGYHCVKYDPNPPILVTIKLTKFSQIINDDTYNLYICTSDNGSGVKTLELNGELYEFDEPQQMMPRGGCHQFGGYNKLIEKKDIGKTFRLKMCDALNNCSEKTFVPQDFYEGN